MLAMVSISLHFAGDSCSIHELPNTMNVYQCTRKVQLGVTSSQVHPAALLALCNSNAPKSF